MHYFYNIPRFSPACTLLLFYNIGNMLSINKNKVKFNNIIIFAISLGLLIFLNFKGFVAMNNNDFTDPIFLLICSFFGIYFTMYLSKVLEYKTKYIKNVLCYIGQNTLIIMGIHFIGFKLVMLLQLQFGVINYSDLAVLTGVNNDNWWYIVYILFGIGIPLLYNYFIKIMKNKFIVN